MPLLPMRLWYLPANARAWRRACTTSACRLRSEILYYMALLWVILYNGHQLRLRSYNTQTWRTRTPLRIARHNAPHCVACRSLAPPLLTRSARISACRMWHLPAAAPSVAVLCSAQADDGGWCRAAERRGGKASISQRKWLLAANANNRAPSRRCDSALSAEWWACGTYRVI